MRKSRWNGQKKECPASRGVQQAERRPAKPPLQSPPPSLSDKKPPFKRLSSPFRTPLFLNFFPDYLPVPKESRIFAGVKRVV